MAGGGPQEQQTSLSGFLLVVAVVMVITGTLNTIAIAFQNKSDSIGLEGPPATPFKHPGLQTMFMFFGETMCLVIFNLMFWRASRAPGGKIPEDLLPKTPFSRFVLAIPTIFDATSTTLSNLGLILTTPSVFQMCRGSIVIFVAGLSRVMFGRYVQRHQMIGVLGTVTGISLVGLSSVIYEDDVAHAPIAPVTGFLCVIFSQLFTAMQFVAEERFVLKYGIPSLQAVGWEGFWGVVIALGFAPILYFIPGPSAGSFDNYLDGLIQVSNNRTLMLAVLTAVCSIAIFNYAGVTITRRLSSTHRATLDGLRTITVWGVSLALDWETFHFLQLVGFVILFIGTMFYNEVIELPAWAKPAKEEQMFAPGYGPVGGDAPSSSAETGYQKLTEDE